MKVGAVYTTVEPRSSAPGLRLPAARRTDTRQVMSLRSLTLALGALGLAGAAACASGSGPSATDAPVDRDAADPDGAMGIDAADSDGTMAIDAATIDAATIDARIDAAVIDAALIDAALIDGPTPVIASLLLTEIVLTPTGGELVEIVNPTGAAIDLSTYYLSDAPQYFRLPAGVVAVAAENTDFVARFPAGATIAAHSVVTVAISTATAFTTAYPTIAPTYSIGTGPSMMTLLTAGTPTLTNGGEPVVLFFWNGATDRVTDVDIMNAGAPSGANPLVNKSAVAIDGPDVDATPTAYLTDAMTLPTQSVPGTGDSTKRIGLESAAVETQSGGNGVDGHDETSEQTGVTWDNTAYTAPTPGLVPAAIGP